MVVTPLALHQVYEELVRIPTVELGKSALGETPEVLDSVYMPFSLGKFVLAVENSVMVIAVQNQSFVSLPIVLMNRRAFERKSLYYRH